MKVQHCSSPCETIRPDGLALNAADGIKVQRRLSRSEEHTSELQSPCNLVCRLLLEKKNTILLYDCNCIYPSATPFDLTIPTNAGDDLVAYSLRWFLSGGSALDLDSYQSRPTSHHS